MNKFWIVLAHTYWIRFKSKSFLITTALFLVFIIGLANIQSIGSLFDSEEKLDTVAVIDETETVYPMLEENMAPENSILLELYDGTVEEAKEAVKEEDYVGVLSIQLDQASLPVATYHTNQLSNTQIQTQLESQLQQIKVILATNQAGIDQTVLDSIYAPVDFDTVAIESNDGTTVKTEEELSGARGLVYAMLFLLYFSVLMYGNMIAQDIANEKSSRVMEILISSSSPVSQMFAKIIGIALLGLTQIGLIMIVAFVMIQQKQDQLVGGFFEFFGLSDASVATFVYAVVFFLLGYFLYATLSAMLGSLVSRTEDVQQLMMPVILLIAVGFMFAVFGLTSPESGLVTWVSYIPFFTPMVMFLRVGMLDVPFWEIALSIGIMIASITVLAILGARVYRGGVLMYGRSASLKDFKKAIQLSKKE